MRKGLYMHVYIYTDTFIGSMYNYETNPLSLGNNILAVMVHGFCLWVLLYTNCSFACMCDLINRS